jgi:flagellar motor switch protein FliN/FliY
MANEDDKVPVAEPEHSPAQAQELQEPEALAVNPQAPDAGEPHDASGAVYEIPVEITAILGTATLQVSQLLKLGRGAVVELDRKVDEEIEIHANNRLVARGEVMVINDRLAVTMTKIIKTRDRR